MSDAIDLTDERPEGQERELRNALIKVCLEAIRQGLSLGTAGNASVRLAKGLLITPASVPYSEMIPSDIVYVEADGGWLGRQRPSSETEFHQRLLAGRADANSVVHLHSPAASALASLRLDVPPFHELVAIVGGDSIRCAEYAPAGSPRLADCALQALQGRKGCLLANHGQVALGSTPGEALVVALEIEALCDRYLRARSVAEPVLLSREEMDQAIEELSNADHQPDRPRF